MECNSVLSLKTSRKNAETKFGKRITQDAVAEYLNVSTDTYRSWEQGKTKMDESYLEKLESFFDDDGLFLNKEEITVLDNHLQGMGLKVIGETPKHKSSVFSDCQTAQLSNPKTFESIQQVKGRFQK